MKFISAFFFIIITTVNISAQSNFIKGKVVDEGTGEALTGATIVVEQLKGTGATSDLSGAFSIKVPVATYTLNATMIGYLPVVKTDVIVTAGRETELIIKMKATTVNLNGVTVTSDYFDKSIQENNLSAIVLNAQEIRRSPGSMQDFQRILQGMPGVATTSDQNNELLVRGGTPNQNLTVFDNMEIHSTNHYPNQFNSGGPINMINVDLIEDIQFSTGGFNAKYGDKLSSVLIVNTREGRRTSALKGDANISFAGAGVILEGGINGGKGSWLVSVRKSYLDLIKGAVGLTAVPEYYDAQFKAVYDFSPVHKLSWSGIYGNDMINIKGEPEDENALLANRTDSIGVEKVDVKQHQYATGVTLKSMWDKNFCSQFTASLNKYYYSVDVTDDFTERIYSSRGKLTASRVLSQRGVYRERTNNTEAMLKAEFYAQLDKQNELDFGVSYKTGLFDGKNDVDGDTTRYDFNGDGYYETGPVIRNPAKVKNDIRFFDNSKDYIYVNDKLKLFDERLLLNAGMRYDYFSYSKASNFSPRFSATYYFAPEVLSLNFATGIYYQTQTYPYYGDRYNEGINRGLKNTKAVHYVLGLEYIPAEGMKMNIEGYYKKYSDAPVSEEFIKFYDKTVRSDKNYNTGVYDACGVDFVLQQKLIKDIYGTLSVSYMSSKVDDPRIGKEGRRYPSEYEFPFILTAIIGKRYTGLRDELNNMPFYIKYPSYILPFSNDMEISLKWRYSSGRPYTPQIFDKTEQHREGGITWSRGTWVDSDNINSERYPAYHRLDLAFNSRYNFDAWNLVVFLSIQNLYNRQNIAGYQYKSDGTVDKVYQFSFLPVLGIEAEF
jgi:hypothetical protein